MVWCVGALYSGELLLGSTTMLLHKTMTLRAALSLSLARSLFLCPREIERDMYGTERLKDGDGHGGTWHGPNEET